ncbi:MAG: hemerythrin domain-containing protein [Acidimicrobiia bacterium]|nr:hemerythrin domain-containing protein [Acidimicrobiia bacterium]
MCEYCGCRRIPEIERLGREHESIVEIADEAYAQRDDRAARNALLDRLREALVPHAEREERGVFAEARRVGMGGWYVADLEDDHRRFKEVLDDPASLDVPAMVRLLEDLDRHIAIEEYEVFPAAVARFDEDQWNAIDARG